MAEAGRLCPKAGQAKRPGGVKKASVLTKDRDTKMYPIFLEDEGQTMHLHRAFSAVPLRVLLSGAAACAYRRLATDTLPCNVGWTATRYCPKWGSRGLLAGEG